MKVLLNTTHDFLCDFTENYNVFPTKPGFLKDQLASVWQFWRPERAIFLVSPTGSGKTTFITDEMVEEILKNPNQHLILVSNRIALDVAIKRKISQKTGFYTHFNDAALHEMSAFKNITIVSYQQLKNHMKFSEKSFSTVSHVVFDEAHYFASDATFSSGNGALLERIPHVFKNAVRIYITATPAQVLTHISASECNSFANSRWQKQWETHHNSIISGHLHYTQIINNTKNVFEKTFWDSATPSPILYMMHPDFSWINLHFFQSAKEIETLLDTKNKKSLYFVSNKAQGQELHEKFPDSAYFDADTKAENPVFLKSY